MAAAVAVLGGLGVVLLTPHPVDRPLYGTILRALQWLHGRGLPASVDYFAVEALANVLLFVPLGFLAGALLPARRWWLALLLCAAVAAGAETVQELFLPRRQGSIHDVLNNSGGALLGIAGAAADRLLRTLWRRRRRGPAAHRSQTGSGESGAAATEGEPEPHPKARPKTEHGFKTELRLDSESRFESECEFAGPPPG